MDIADNITEMVLRTRIEGADEIEAGAKAADRFAEAERRAAAALQRSIAPYQKAAEQARALAEARVKIAQAAQIPMPPQFHALREASAMTTRAQERFGGRPGSTGLGFGGAGGGLAKGLLSRFGAAGAVGAEGAAGAAGLAGLEGLAAAGGPVGLAVAGVVMVGKAAYETSKKLFEMARESAEVTQRFSDLKRLTGGNSLDAARAHGLSRLTGVDAGGASRSFNERITSDPFAMGLAAQMGISNTPGMYGKRDFGAQYKKAIERTAALRDRSARERTAESLGIGQEVDRYRLMGPDARNRASRFAETTARVNNPEAERKAARLQAAVANEAQARENLMNSLGQFINGGDRITNLVNEFADIENAIANRVTSFTAFLEPVAKFAEKLAPHRLARRAVTPAWDKASGKADELSMRVYQRTDAFTQGLPGSEAARGLHEADRQIMEGRKADGMDGMTAQAANTQAMNNLTTAFLKYAGKVYGGGERARNAAPSGLDGANLHRALQSGGLNLGYLM